MRRIERQRDSARRIRKINGTLRIFKGLPKVVVSSNNGLEEEIVDKVHMEQVLLDAYEGTLTQSNTTPCMQSPLVERLGLCATEETARYILQGKQYDDNVIDVDTNEILKYLRYKEGTEERFRPKPLI